MKLAPGWRLSILPYAGAALFRMRTVFSVCMHLSPVTMSHYCYEWPFQLTALKFTACAVFTLIPTSLWPNIEHLLSCSSYMC